MVTPVSSALAEAEVEAPPPPPSSPTLWNDALLTSALGAIASKVTGLAVKVPPANSRPKKKNARDAMFPGKTPTPSGPRNARPR